MEKMSITEKTNYSTCILNGHFSHKPGLAGCRNLNTPQGTSKHFSDTFASSPPSASQSV